MFFLVFIIVFGGLFFLFIKNGSSTTKAYNQEKALTAKQKRQEELDKKYNREQLINYRKSLAPANSYAWLQLYVDNRAAIGLNDIHRQWTYMFVDRTNYMITFPEAINGKKRKFYLLNIDFTPKYVLNEQTQGVGNTVTNGNVQGSYHGSNSEVGDYYGGFGSESGSSNSTINTNSTTNYQGSGTINKVEQPSHALLTIAPIDLSHSFRINVTNIMSGTINFIKEYFLIGELEKQKLGIKD